MLDIGAVFQGRLTLTDYQWSLLVRGLLEISCEIAIKVAKGKYTKALLETNDILYFFFSECGTDEVQCFLVKQHNFEKDELQTTAQATEKKKKKSEKTSVRSKDIRSTLKTVPIPSKHSQVLELIEID